MRPHATIISADRMLVIASPLDVGHVLTLAILDVGKAERAFIIQSLNACDEIDLGMIIGAKPGDREMAPCSYNQLIGLFAILRPADDNRFPIAILLFDGVNELGAALMA